MLTINTGLTQPRDAEAQTDEAMKQRELKRRARQDRQRAHAAQNEDKRRMVNGAVGERRVMRDY